MENKFIFDVDGTLTPSRSNMNGDFQNFFLDFCYENSVYLVTGSDHKKTLEQVGIDVCEATTRIYNCNGNDVWEKEVNIHSNDWVLPEDAHEWLSEQLTASAFPLRTGLHFEHRPGMVNFSVVGRNATRNQRAEYVKWDTKFNERDYISHNFNLVFPTLEAKVGGETGIDIAPKGCNKSQILKDFKESDFIVFFGDRMEEDGNDYPLAKALEDSYSGTNHAVSGWQDTWNILNAYINNRT